MKKILVIALILATFTIRVDSQVFINKSKPLSKVKQLDKNNSIQGRLDNLKGLSDLSTIPKEQVNLFSNTKLEDIVNNIKLKNIESNPIAIPIKTNFNTTNSGKWDTLANGDRVWRLYLDLTQNNTSILVFKELSIPYGGFLHIFDKEEDMSFGPITFNTNSDGGGWMTHVLPFSNIVLEYVQPKGVIGNPKIEISKVAQMTTDNIDSVFNNSKSNQIQSKSPQIGYGITISDYEGGISSVGFPIACNDTLEAYSRSAVQYIYLSEIKDSEIHDSFDAKNAVLLSTTDPSDCKAYIATVWHVAWQDEIMMRDYVSFRFNWKRYKPDSTCCVYPSTQDWSVTIDYSKIADYCGAVRKVWLPGNLIDTADFAIVEMLDYPIHNAYFSDWSAECITDTSEIKMISHKIGWKPLMYLNGRIVDFKCQSNSPNTSLSSFKLINTDCISGLGLYSGDSGSGLFKKKNGLGLYNYEYIGATKNSGGGFESLNWVYDIDEPSNRPKTYLDPINTGLLKNVGYNAVPACQTADCCELIYSKLRPEKVNADILNQCCTNLIIEEKFPDDISCGDYRVVVKKAGTNDTLYNDIIVQADIRYPNRFILPICEQLPVGFQRYKKFSYEIKFIKGDTTVLSCNRTLDFTCQKCDSDKLQIDLIPNRDDCCYDIKIKEISEDACQFKHIFLKFNGKYSPIKYSAITSSIIGVNQDSISITGICNLKDATKISIYLYDDSIELNAYGEPMAFDEERYIKLEEFVVDLTDCDCCKYITVEPEDDCGEYTITQTQINEYFENCGRVDSVRVDLTDINGRVIIKNIHNQGDLNSNSTNIINISTLYYSQYSYYTFYLYDENGDLICTKELVQTNCSDECLSFITRLKYGTDNDEDPCCQTIELKNDNASKPIVSVNIRKVDLTDPNSPVISSPINPSPIILNYPTTVEYEICLTEEHTTFVIEFTYDNNVVCKQLFVMDCKSCCRKIKEVKINFIKTDSDTTCCYVMDVTLPTDENCSNEPAYMKVINTVSSSIEFQGAIEGISGVESHEFCNESDNITKYKIEFFSDDDYTNSSRLCIEEAELKPCAEHCCDNAYIEAVKDTSFKSAFTCCWKFNVKDFNCEVYRVEVYDDFTFTNMRKHFRPDGSFDLQFNKKRSDLYGYGDPLFLPYHTEGYTYGHIDYLTNGPLNLETLSERITSNICLSNYNPDVVSNGGDLHNNVKIRLFGPNGEECILGKDLKCTKSTNCCDFVYSSFAKFIDPLNPDKCCWKFGYYVEPYLPPYCQGKPLEFKKIIMYHDQYILDSNRYLSELYPIDSPNFMPYYVNSSIDTLLHSSQIKVLSPSICATPGANPTDRILIYLINEDGDTCTVDALVTYCDTEEEALIDYTSSYKNDNKLNLNDFVIKVDQLSTIIDLEIKDDKITDYEVNVFNTEGRRLNLTTISNGRNSKIDISKLSSGIYYIVVTSENQVISKSFSIIR